jgi:hypothetical protein
VGAAKPRELDQPERKRNYLLLERQKKEKEKRKRRRKTKTLHILRYWATDSIGFAIFIVFIDALFDKLY